jgi:hypothetical protein
MPVNDASFGDVNISTRSIPQTFAGLSPKETPRLEIIVVIEVIGREGTDLIDPNLMSETMTTPEFPKKFFRVVGLSISQYLRILGEGDELGRDLAIDTNHWMSSPFWWRVMCRSTYLGQHEGTRDCRLGSLSRAHVYEDPGFADLAGISLRFPRSGWR